MKLITIVSLAIFLLLTACSSTVQQNNDVDTVLAANDNVELGLAYLKQQDMPRAKAKLLLALQQAPHSPIVLDALAYFWEVTGNSEEAKKYYAEAVDRAPHDGAALNNYGVFLCKQKQYSQAEKLLLKAANEENYLNTAKAYENAGLCALEIPDDKKAKAYFAKALQQDPQLAKLNT